MIKNNDVKYFIPGANQESDRRASVEIREQLQRDFKDIFNGIGCFDRMFSVQLRPDSTPYQVT